MATSSAPSIFDGGVDLDWKKYITHRPDYTASNFYPLIWNYHERHSDCYIPAHDVDTGPGNVAEVLAKRFDRVIASDPSKFHVDVAQKRINSPSVTFHQCRAEDLTNVVDRHEHGQADLVAVAECIPLLDAEQAITGFAKLLRPGGTVAIWFYGRPIFADKKQDKCQDLYDKITSKAFERIFPLKASQMESAVKTMASWLDIVIFPSETLTDVQRIKWNISIMKSRDKIEKQVDRDFWAKEDTGVEWVKGFIDTQYPWETTDDEIGAQLKPMYEELEAAMGGKGSTVKIAWPVVLLLATKNELPLLVRVEYFHLTGTFVAS